MYDEKLAKSVLLKMRYAPLLYMAFAYWMTTNKQLLSNDWLIPEMRKSDADMTGHVFSLGLLKTAFTEAPAWPLYVMFWTFLIFILFGKTLHNCLKGCWQAFGKVEVDEDIA